MTAQYLTGTVEQFKALNELDVVSLFYVVFSHRGPGGKRGVIGEGCVLNGDFQVGRARNHSRIMSLL